MDSKVAILYLTHHWDRVHARRFARLRKETMDLGDSFVLFQSAQKYPALEVISEAPGERNLLHTFDPIALPSKLGYGYLTPKGIVPGCTHFPLVDFAGEHHYAYYWLIENDVEFSGNWGNLIGSCSEDRADLIAAHVTPYKDDPGWIWWRFLTSPLHRPLDPARLLRAFFPVYRISREGLSRIDRMQRAGWRGHYEALLPTLLNASGMAVADLRKFGQFYLGTRQDPPHALAHLDQLSTLRWRPAVSDEEFLRRFTDNVIFHPVKQAWTFNGKAVEYLESASKN
jgi:hypothetical protein